MTLLSARTKLDLRIGKQYNQDSEAQSLLDDWLNSACQYCWEYKPMGFNETNIETGDGDWPTISNDEFTLPTTFKSLLEVLLSTGTGSANFEDKLDFRQEGRNIVIINSGLTPTKIRGHTFYTPVTDTSASLSSYIPDYLIIELAVYFAIGETKDRNDSSPIMINRAMGFFKDWIKSYSFHRVEPSMMKSKDGVSLGLIGDTYSSGDIRNERNVDDTLGWG